MRSRERPGILSLIINLSLLVIAIALLVLVVTGQIVLAVVEGSSMEPLLQTGDVVIVIRSKNINIGDVVVYKKYDGVLIIHRVVKFLNLNGKIYVVTKGDNNFFTDPPISKHQIIGKVLTVNGMIVKIPSIGLISLWIKSILK